MGFTWDDPPHPIPELDIDAEVIEATIRRLMAQHAAIEPRGFDTIRQRADLHRRIDAAFDQYALATTSSDDIPVA